MGFKIDTSGFDEFLGKIDHAAKKAKELEGENTVPFDESFTPAFMQQYTAFRNIDDFLTAAGIDSTDPASFDSFPEDQLDNFVKANSSFSSWESMLTKALEEWTFKQLGF